MKKNIPIITVALLSLNAFNIYTQEKEEYRESLVQITLITPVGTNGINSANYKNNFSFNIIAGYNGELDGLEIGGFGNLLKGNAKGFQASGFANVVQGGLDGIQAAGFLNYVSKSSEGVQISGFGNINETKIVGFQAAGFGNIAGEGSDVSQVSGFGNIAEGKVTGIQAGGFMNIAENIEGVQVAGFMNIAEDIEGAQLSGFINIAEKVDGVQVSFINICDSIDGVPIGFISFVKKGYRTWEFWGSDALHMNLAYKMGANRFYNVFAFGGHFTSGFKWAFGYGIGTMFNIGDNTKLNLEAISYDVRNNARFNYYVSLNQLRINYGMNFSENKGFFMGPTFNVIISESEQANYIANQIAPYNFFNRTNRYGKNVKMWVGINAGMRF